MCFIDNPICDEELKKILEMIGLNKAIKSTYLN